jgi:4-amino-4-deoxy-L-arabinose transferase-like glycosyltransferase
VHARRSAVALILFLLVVRLGALFLSPLGLHGDEAQYWAWSKDLDLGYFTKPPMIAYVIAVTTSLFGDAEWAVRLSSAPLHALTSYVLFLAGRRLFDARTGFWAAALYALMPALWLSSLIVSTDVPLLLCYALAIHAWVHLRIGGANWLRAVQLGAAIGLGVMAKYAMLFFLPALGLCLIFDPKTRAALLNKTGALAAVLGLLIVLPNIIWNVNHDFATLSHTADNANLGHSIPFHPVKLLTFLGSQFGVFGPVSFAALACALAGGLSGRLGDSAKWLSLFSLSPLLIIMLQALLSRANANWAVTAYIGGSLITAHAMVSYWPKVKRWVQGGLIFQTLIAFILIGAVMSPSLTNRSEVLSNSVKRLRAWPATLAALESVIARGHGGQKFESVATDKRIIFYNLKYYGLERTRPLYMWTLHSVPQNHAELTSSLPPARGPVLIIHYDDNHAAPLKADFNRLEALPPLDVKLGGGKRRQLKLWAGYGYVPTQER